MPVFPPMAASTMHRRLVGILIKSIPRLYVPAANPPISVIIPPPKLISRECLSAFLSVRACQIMEQFSIFLLCSPARSISGSTLFNSSGSNGKQCLNVLSSVRMNTDEYPSVSGRICERSLVYKMLFNVKY